MKRGPKPIPTAILKLRGSWRAAGRPDGNCGSVRLTAPVWLSLPAQQMFASLAEILHVRGVTTSADQLALALLAEAFCDFRRACETLAAEGETVLCGADGTGRKLHPMFLVKKSALSEIRQGLVAFGLTPADRASVPFCEPGRPDLEDLISSVKGEKRGTRTS